MYVGVCVEKLLAMEASQKISTLPLSYALDVKHKLSSKVHMRRDSLELAFLASFDLPKQEMRERELPIKNAPRRGSFLATWHSPMHKRALL